MIDGKTKREKTERGLETRVKNQDKKIGFAIEMIGLRR